MDDEARRELEQRALRNVRGLVDKIEHDDKADRRSQLMILGAIVLGAVVVAVLLAVMLVRGDKARRDAVVSPMPATAPGAKPAR